LLWNSIVRWLQLLLSQLYMNSYRPAAAFTLERWQIYYWFKKKITKHDKKLPVHPVIYNCLIIKPIRYLIKSKFLCISMGTMFISAWYLTCLASFMK